jgi:hypothetical protein
MLNTANDMAQAIHNDDFAMLSPGPGQKTAKGQLFQSFEAEGGRKGPFDQEPPLFGVESAKRGIKQRGAGG